MKIIVRTSYDGLVDSVEIDGKEVSATIYDYNVDDDDRECAPEKIGHDNHGEYYEYKV